MNYWFTRPEAAIEQSFVKRFDPLHWTVEFPRGATASTVTSADGHGLTVETVFLRKGDLVGLAFESHDRFAHPAHAREHDRDYSQCVLSFRWQSSGLAGLDAVNGPTLTIEGSDAQGQPRTWWVRLWNYAQGSPDDAEIRIDFDDLHGGFSLPADADEVDPRFIDRMFISLVPPGYVEASAEPWAQPLNATVTLSGIRYEGARSVLSINDAMVPQHELRICTAYDDLYHLPPEWIVQAIERLGYRGVINHYVGMSHYMALSGDGLVDSAAPMCGPALAWHRDFARAAKARDFDVIWSLSYEILDPFCPEEWKQRAYDGSAAATGYTPPSALVSPANGEAVSYLASVAVKLADIAVEAGLRPRVQIGEPWWWVTPAGGICLYDDAAKTALGGDPVEIASVGAPMSAAQMQLLDDAGALLAASTAQIAAAVKAAHGGAETLLLVFIPGVLDPARPQLRRANMPVGWAKPAFDVLQLEDYDWLTAGRSSPRQLAYQEALERLGYAPQEQHYFAGFVPTAAERDKWRLVLKGADEARRRGVAETFLWALPQVLRDGLTLFGEGEQVQAFDDISFPIEIGAEASVAPCFSTTVVTSGGGHEHRNVNWTQARLRFDAGPGVRGEAELQQLIAFFRARRGAAVGFRFRDPYDYSSNAMSGAPGPADQLVGSGDGERTAFALVKHYGDEQRRITRPSPGSVRVAIDGVERTGGWTLEASGIVEFDEPPASGTAISAGFLFDVPVRFAEDRLEINRASFLAGEAPSVTLIEIREDQGA